MKDFDEENMSVASFPESIINQLIKKDFLEALYTIIVSLLSINSIANCRYCLEYLEKIMAAKYTLVKNKLMPKFMQINLKGTIELLNCFIHGNSTDGSIFLKVIECSNSFLDVFGMCELSALNNIDEADFMSWVEQIFKLPLFLLNSN